MGLFEEFATDDKEEVEGVWAEMSEGVKLKLKRAGGANKAYESMHLAKLKPYRNRLKGGTVPPVMLPIMRGINRECFAKTVVADWQTKIGEEWHSGIQGFEEVDGRTQSIAVNGPSDLWPVTEKNIKLMFEALPEFFELVAAFADDAAAFREEGLETIEGN